MNNKDLIIVDVSWLYNSQFDKYEIIFDTIPREVVLNYLLTMPDLPGADESIYDLFTLLYSMNSDTTEGASDYFDLLDELCELIISTLEKRTSFFIRGSYVVLAWLNDTSVMLANLQTNRRLMLNSSFNKKDYNKCFEKRPSIYTALSISENLPYWYNVILGPKWR